LRRRRRVVFRCDPLGPPVPRPDGAPRPGVAGEVVDPPVRAPPKPVDEPGRDGAPVRGAFVEGRALMGRDPPAPGARLGAPGAMGRRVPGGGGMGRPMALMGRPGGGGMGRPDELSGGRCEAPPSPSPPAPRCVGRIVVGPSGDAVRVGTGFATTARLRTTLGASATGAGALSAAGAGATGAAGALEITGAGATREGVSVASAKGDALADVAFAVDAVDFVALVALVGSSGCTSRRSPSASARRRMRSACASSIEAEGLEAPIPSF